MINAGMVFDTLYAGIDMGRKAKTLFPLKFEEMLKMPLEEVRKDLNITPVREGLGKLVPGSRIKGCRTPLSNKDKGQTAIIYHGALLMSF